MQDAEYEDFNFRSLSYDVGCSVEDPYRGNAGVGGEQHGVDPALDTLVMDTPPDMLQTPPDLSSLDVSSLTQTVEWVCLSSRSINRLLKNYLIFDAYFLLWCRQCSILC